jgi:hypothetical protein
LDLEQYLEKALEFEDVTEGRNMATFFKPGMLAETKSFDGVAERGNITRYTSIVGKFNFAACQLRLDFSFFANT